MADPTTSTLTGDAQKKEKDDAFDLLDALTKSGGLPVEHASLHVVAAMHRFDKTVLETIVQDNMNFIDKAELSTCFSSMLSIAQGWGPWRSKRSTRRSR